MRSIDSALASQFLSYVKLLAAADGLASSCELDECLCSCHSLSFIFNSHFSEGISQEFQGCVSG